MGETSECAYCTYGGLFFRSFLIRLADRIDLPFARLPILRFSSNRLVVVHIRRVSLWVLVGAMNLLQSQSQTQVQRDGLPNNAVGKGVHCVTPGSPSNFSSSELRTLHDENEISSGQDPEKSAIKHTGKYAKYAGEPPDGGLKAWTVIIACVKYGFPRNVPTDRNNHGSCVQDFLHDMRDVGAFSFQLRSVRMS